MIPPGYIRSEGGRNTQTKRILTLAILLSRRAYALTELAELGGVSTKTIRRDLHALECIGIPVYMTSDDDSDFGGPLKLWRVDPHWMRKFV